jgi:hypothetical protein
LCKGSDLTVYQEMRAKLLILLKGSKKKKDELRVFSHFTEVWKVRANHHHPELPAQYMFVLTRCYKQDCPHPRCKQAPPLEDMRWFANGPTLQQSVLPVPDPTRPFGGQNCTTCQGTCCGHFLSPHNRLLRPKKDQWHSLFH